MSQRLRLDWVLWPCLGICLISSPVSAGDVRGRITGQDQQPIARVTVTLEPRDAGARAGGVRSVETDENGEFRLEGVEPGSYRFVAEKRNWVGHEGRVFVSEEELEVNVVMELTWLFRALARVQLGILVYVVLFGLVVLAFNMWVVPEPSREVNVVGWMFMVAGLVIACVKALWVQAFFLAVLGGAGGALVHKIGGKVAARRIRQIEQERDEQAAEGQQKRERLASLVGKEGITITDLKACGNAKIDGEIIEVRAAEGFLPPQTRVLVTRLEGKTPVVEAV